MNVFRLFLCLLGLVTFLAVRHLSSPASTPQEPSLPSPSLALPAFPGAGTPTAPSFFSSQPTDRFEVNGQIVKRWQSPQGVRYDLMTVEGQALASNLSESQLQLEHPSIYSLVQLSLANAPANGAPPLPLQ